jgi:hypothetical protein
VRRLRKCDEQPIIDRIAGRIPKWKGDLLNAAGRTALVKATLSAIPVHMAIALGLSPWPIQTIDKLRRGFIWCGSEAAAAGKCRVAWEAVCRPTDLGGLGVSDLRPAGIALRVRWEVQARAEGRLALRSSERAVVAVFQAATTFHLGDGKSTFFWTDNWLMGSCPMRIAPTVFASVGARKRKATVADALRNNEWVRHFTGAPTMRALLEIGNLCDLIDGVQLSSQPDTFTWRIMLESVGSLRIKRSRSVGYSLSFRGTLDILKQVLLDPRAVRERGMKWCKSSVGTADAKWELEPVAIPRR